ncbi:MAG: hypothetical protein ACXVLQ_05925 [Bacteriovorax sp.]
MAINKKTIAESFLTKELEIQTNSDAFSLKIAETKDGLLHQLWRNGEEQGSGKLPNTSNLIAEFNLLIDSLFEKKIHQYQQKLNRVDLKTFTPTEVSQEDKALEWMKVSFGLLEKAIIQSLTDPELLFQTMLFLGHNPKTSQDEIRVITFNLDIKFEFLPNGLLRVRIYDDKKAEFGSSKKAVLEGDFNFRKREMLDQLTRLISAQSKGIKLA